MTYELHPLCTLFPRLSGAEFDALVAIEGWRDDGLAALFLERDGGDSSYWHVSHLDVRTGIQSDLQRPAHESGVLTLVKGLDDVERYEFKPGLKKAPADHLYFVYFIQPIAGGLVKIGVSVAPEARLAALQCGSPVDLQILRVIPCADRKLESRIHAAFAEHRVRGEWFLPTVLQLELPQ
jgi:hypothetical protein